MKDSDQSVPGVVGALVIRYESSQPAAGADGHHPRQWFLHIETVDEYGDAVDTVGHLIAYTVDHCDRSEFPASALDAQSPGLGHVARVALDAGGVEDGLLLVDTLRLKPEWQGHGLEPLVVGMAIEHLGPNLAVLRAETAGDVASASVARLGFRHVEGGAWVLRPERARFTRTMNSIRSALGLA
ncbi:hypothetical protein ACQPW3_15290 [Actinosynnema sp. CA-248983]